MQKNRLGVFAFLAIIVLVSGCATKKKEIPLGSIVEYSDEKANGIRP